jgi:hypothetical protein
MPGGTHATDGALVVFLSHTLRESVLDRFEKLRREARPRDDVLFAYDATDATEADLRRAREAAGESLHTYRTPAVFDVDYPDPWTDPERRTLVPGNLHLLYLHLADAAPGYDRYWFVEYDVAYTGSWSDVFDAVDDDADVVGTTLYRYEFDPDWYWWSSFDPTADVDRSDWVRGFFPLLRLSRDALDLLDEAYRDGWSGHPEATLPTLASHHGLALEDIGGDGRFVADGNENRFYTNSPEHGHLWPGSFVYRPARPRPGRRPDTLYHPVKPDRTTLRYWGTVARRWAALRMPTP